MSWSLSAVGKSRAVADRVAKSIADSKCSEPEETIKNAVGAALATALAAFPEGMAVKVVASGSQSSDGKGNATNSLQVVLEPLYGFVE